jgi:hypothetical protein
MKMVSKNKLSLYNLLTILKYKHHQHFMYRVFECITTAEPTIEGNYYYSICKGDMAWSTTNWITRPTDKNMFLIDGYKKDKNGIVDRTKPIYVEGCYFTSLLDICKKYDIAVQIFGSEPGNGFQEMVHIKPNGIYCSYVCELEFDDDLKPVKEMKNYGVFSDTETIYNGVIPKIIGITPDGEVEGVDNILIKCIKGGING